MDYDDESLEEVHEKCSCKEKCYNPCCERGRPGRRGPRGRPGSPGRSGSPGPKGEDGEQGCPGRQGARGEKGEQGEKGDRGQKGERGERGFQGEKGDKGDKGDRGERGPQGDTGRQGEMGDQGEPGEQGEQGIQGERGDTGEQGERGERGDTGEQGERGDTGEQGERGDTGEQGERGDTGEQGIPGETGPRGDTGPQQPAGIATFINTYSTSTQVLATEDPVVFDSNNALFGSVSHTPGESLIYLWSPGFYHIYYNLYHIEPCQFTLFLNNNVVPGSIVGSPTGASQNSSVVIIEILQSDLIVPFIGAPGGFAATFQLRNHTSFSPTVILDGATGSGSASPQIRATITISQLTTTIIV